MTPRPITIPEWLTAYAAALEAARTRHPDAYGWPAGDGAHIAAKMTRAILSGAPVGGLSSSPAMKSAARAFGITKSPDLAAALRAAPPHAFEIPPHSPIVIVGNCGTVTL